MSKLKWFGILWVGVILSAAGWTHAQQGASPLTKLTADDYIEIQQLYARYNHIVDFGENAEEWADLFTDDAQNGPPLPGGMRWGRKGLIEYFNYRRQPPREVTKERHWNSNLLITPTPEGAHGSVMFLLIRVGDPPTLLSTHTYEDDLVKTPKGWKYKKRVFAKGPDE